jgi:hypothetical protein
MGVAITIAVTTPFARAQGRATRCSQMKCINILHDLVLAVGPYINMCELVDLGFTITYSYAHLHSQLLPSDYGQPREKEFFRPDGMDSGRRQAAG